MRKFFWLLILFLPNLVIGQESSIDSLIRVIELQKDDTNKVLGYLNISNKSRIGTINYPKAVKYGSEALELSKKIKFKKGVLQSHIALGYAYRDMANRAEAIVSLENAIEYFEKNTLALECPSLIPNYLSTHTALSNIYSAIPDFELAQKYAYKALSIAESFNISRGQSWLTLSILFYKQKNLEQAKSFALKALSDFEKYPTGDDLARTYAYLARYAYQEEDYPKAIEYYSKCQENYKKVNSTYGERIALYNLSSIYLKLEDYEKADSYAKDALSITGKEDLIGLFYLTQLRSELNISKKSYVEALLLSKEAYGYAEKAKSKNQQVEAYNSMLTSYLALKDSGKAFEVSQNIILLKDSLYSIELAKTTAELSKIYDTKSQQREIEFLAKENKLSKQNIAKQAQLNKALENENLLKDEEINQKQITQNALEKANKAAMAEIEFETKLVNSLQDQNLLMVENSKNESIIRWLLSFGLLALIVFSWFFYRNYRKQKIANTKISSQTAQLKILISELHHRVKNNIQFIISILRMQARVLTDEEAKKALANSENRLQSMALVHEKLYSSERFRKVSLKDYLEDLMKALESQHKNTINNFSYSIVDQSSITVNLEVAIPFGLIVNELLTNSFKHSFKNIDEGIVQIELKNETPNNYTFTYHDNGPGFDLEAASQTSSKLGLKLVNLLAEQLNGNVNFSFASGLLFTLKFKTE